VDYMYSCGNVGKERADEILIRVPLKLHKQSAGSERKDTHKKVQTGDIVGVMKDVNQTCFEHQREAVRRMVCRVRSRLLPLVTQL
jgi:nuclear pore complex protein Nup85